MSWENPASKSLTRSVVRAHRWIGWEVPVIVVACALTVLAGAHFDIVEEFYQFSRSHDSWELDEFALLFVTLSIAGIFLSTRRYLQMRAEFSKRVEAEQKMQYLALNDAMTGLANRRAFITRLQEMLAHESRGEFAVVMIDLDRFKPINDLHGHDIGDRFLQIVSQRLQEEIKPGEMLARLGGDEFAAILCDCAGDDQLDRIVTRMVRAVEQPAEIGAVICQVGASAGVTVVHPESELGVEQFLKQADMALYDAKESGRGRHVYFDEEMNEKALERSTLEIGLRKAVRSGQVEPHYQPLIRLSDGELEGYEILARWNHPTRGLIPPERFIPIAEDMGLISELTLSLLNAVCKEAQDWPEGLFASINISPVQLRNDDIVSELLGALSDHGLPPEFLEVEITENALIEDLEMAELVLNRLAEAGIRLALDDFGTGYSSLNQLRSLPFTKLKIDKSFILSMSESAESRKIVNAVLSLSKSLGLTSTAEGIETEEVAAWLKKAGCGQGQGFYFGRPDREVGDSLATFLGQTHANKLRKLIGRDEPDETPGPDAKRASNE